MIRPFQVGFGPLARGASAFALVAALAFTALPAAEAQRSGQNRNQDSEEQQENRTFSARVGEVFQRALEQNDNEQFQQAMETLNRALGMDPTPYERSMIQRVRGSIFFELDNMPEAINAFRAALDAGPNVMEREERTALRVNIGQLLIATDRIDEGLRELETAISEGAEINTNLARLLAQGYAVAERWSDGLQWAERWYERAENKAESDYQLMLVYYNELDRPSDQLRVTREQVNAFPGGRPGWQNLASLLARTEQDQLAFEANKLMYLNGMFREESELVRLVQYYSYFENPYRGATILEREMNAGRIARNMENLRTLSNMWRQAAEFERAIPVLRQIAQQAGDGTTSLQLAEAYYQLNDFENAERAFEQALSRGGLNQPGEAWVLLGTVRFNEGNLDGALQAFREGARIPQSRTQANGWIQFVEGQIEGEARRVRQREQVLIDECRLTAEGERRIATIVGEADDQGRVRISIPERCRGYFNQYGQQYREVGWTDEQAQARLQQLARGEAEEAGLDPEDEPADADT
ncbi:tetratricopeptide repeat protein [Glycocaulis profundi]|nr:tetratricopeptide repeat protein [Glycocaulis profundi]